MKFVHIVGSLTTYQYIADTDLDVHMGVDIPAFIKTEKPDLSPEEAEAFLDNLRKVEDKKKLDLNGTKHPIEYYFELPSTHQENSAIGIYNVLTDTWDKEPFVISSDFDIEESKPKFIADAMELAADLDVGFGSIKREIKRIEELQEVIGAWTTDQKKKFQKKLEEKLQIIETEIEELIKIKEKVVEDRRGPGFDPHSEAEVKFKYLQKFGYFFVITQLKELLEKTEDSIAVEESNIPEIKEIVHEAALHIITAEDNHVLMIDFDKTISDHEDKPLPGVEEAFKKLHEDGWTLVLYSVRANNEEGKKHIEDFMSKHHLEYDDIFIGKPLADYYIDDRAIQFKDWSDVLKQVKPVEKEAQQQVEYPYSSTQFNLPKDVAQKIVEWSVKNIPKEDLFEDESNRYGRELESHITLLYGLTTDEADEVIEILKNESKIKVKFGKTKYFNTKLGQDVINIPVQSNDIMRLHEKIKKLDHETLQEEYVPHVTVAYVKEGLGKNFADEDILGDLELELDLVKFSPKEGDPTNVELRAKIKDLITVEAFLAGAAKQPKQKVVPIETMTIGGETVQVVVGQKELDQYLNAVKLSLRNPENFDFDNARSAVHDEALENALQVTDFKGNDPYLFAAQVRDAISRYAEDMFDQKYGKLNYTAEFAPSFASSAPNNIWQSDSDLVTAVPTDSVSDEETYQNPIVDKPRKSMWKQVLDALFGDNDKEASFSLQYWLDPNGQEYEGDALKQEGVAPEKLIHEGWVQVVVPSDRQGIVLVVDELEFAPDFLNAFLAKTVGYGDPVTVKDAKGSTITLRYPFKNIRGLIKKQLYAPEQEMAASLTVTASAASDILTLIQNTGGASYDLEEGDLAGTPTYAVSIYPERGVILDHQPTEEEIDAYLQQNSDILGGDNAIGAWSSGGKTYLDVVVALEDVDQAIALGKQHNQIAIYDLQNRVEIPTGGTGEVPKPSNEVKESGYYGPEDPEGGEKEYYSQETDDKNLGNPNQRFMGRPKGPNRSNQDEVVKMIMDQAMLSRNMVAFTQNGFWVAPDGKAYNARESGARTHGEWVTKNAPMLQQRYGIKDAKKRDYFDVAAEMLQKGWARIGDSSRNKFAAIGVEINNIKSIPAGVEDVLATFLQDGDVVIVADLTGNWAEVTYPFKSLQNAVRRAVRGSIIVNAVDYSMEDQETIYNEQHEYNDDPGGGGGWVPHGFSNSSTDYPQAKDMQKVQVFLDRLEKDTTPPIPSYEVTWEFSQPKE